MNSKVIVTTNREQFRADLEAALNNGWMLLFPPQMTVSNCYDESYGGRVSVSEQYMAIIQKDES